MKTMMIAASAALAFFGTYALTTTVGHAFPPSPGPGYVHVEMIGSGGDSSTNDPDCGPGQFHIQDVGGVKVCTPASLSTTERSYDSETGRWVLP